MKRIDLVTALNAVIPGTLEVVFKDEAGKTTQAYTVVKTKKFKRDGGFYDTGTVADELVEVIQIVLKEKL
jgi:hypothetical protein